MNSNKSAVIYLHHLTCLLMTATFTLGELVSPIVRKYGVILDEHLTFQEAVQAEVRKPQVHLLYNGGSLNEYWRHM